MGICQKVDRTSTDERDGECPVVLAGVAQLAEHLFSKQNVAGSTPATRSKAHEDWLATGKSGLKVVRSAECP